MHNNKTYYFIYFYTIFQCKQAAMHIQQPHGCMFCLSHKLYCNIHAKLFYLASPTFLRNRCLLTLTLLDLLAR